jgi:hypothetical protein
MSAADPNLILELGRELSGPRQALLRLVVDCMAEAVVVADMTGRVVLANATARRLLALGSEEPLRGDWAAVRGRYLADGVTPVPPERLLVSRALAGEQVEDEILVLWPPGAAEGAWMSGTARPIRAGDDTVLGCVVVWRDVSAQQRAEAEMRNIASFPLDNPSPVMRVDRGGRLLFANRASAGVLAQWGCVVGESAPRHVCDAAGAALADGRERELELEVGGRAFSFDLAPFPDRGYVNLYGRDVTARRRAEAETRERLRLQEQVAKTAATVPGVVCSFRLGPDGTTTFPYASPAISGIYGVEPDELARDASPIFDLIHPDDVGHVRDTVAASAQAMTAWRDEFRVRNPQKGEIWVEGHSMPLLEPDGAILWHGYIQDVSERKRAEQALRQANENLERRVAERTTEIENSTLALRQTTDQLQRLTAHLESVREEQNARIAREVHDELGGTLTMLKLGLALALEQCSGDPGVADQIRTMLGHADEAIRRIRRISTNLRPPMLDTLGLLATIGWYAYDFSRTTGIRTETTLPKAISLSRERATAVFRIVQEALTNVARHAHATSVSIVLRKRRGRLVVEISDDGNGLPDGCTEDHEGLGFIGMNERARMLGGELQVHRRRPHGTALRLDIPLEKR